MTDAAGNYDESTITYNVVPNALETDTPIITYITGDITKTTAAFTFSSNES